MIPQRNLSLLANRLAKAGGRRIPESVLERDYCLAWFLAEFSRSELHRQTAFKGGTALKRCYFGDYRFSEDLDFTLLASTPLEEILQHLSRVTKSVLRGYDEFDDLPEERRVQSYSLGEIASEKAVALGDRARNEPRDLYDLWYLTNLAGVDLASLLRAIGEKLLFRGMQVEGLQDAIVNKQARLKALWLARLGNQMVALPPFENVFRELRRTMRQARLP